MNRKHHRFFNYDQALRSLQRIDAMALLLECAALSPEVPKECLIEAAEIIQEESKRVQALLSRSKK